MRDDSRGNEESQGLAYGEIIRGKGSIPEIFGGTCLSLFLGRDTEGVSSEMNDRAAARRYIRISG